MYFSTCPHHRMQSGTKLSAACKFLEIKDCTFYWRGPQPPGLGSVVLSGLLGTRLHHRRWAVDDRAKLHLYLQLLSIPHISAWTPSSVRSAEAIDSDRSTNPTELESSWNYPPIPRPVHGKTVLHETGPQRPKGWGILHKLQIKTLFYVKTIREFWGVIFVHYHRKVKIYYNIIKKNKEKIFR